MSFSQKIIQNKKLNIEKKDNNIRVLQFFLILQNPPPPKVTKSTFYDISSSVLIPLSQNCFGKTKVYLL